MGVLNTTTENVWIGTQESTARSSVDIFYKSNDVDSFADAISALVSNQSWGGQVRLPAIAHIRELAVVVVNPEANYEVLGKAYATSDLNASRKALRVLRHLLSLCKTSPTAFSCLRSAFSPTEGYSERQRLTKKQSTYDFDDEFEKNEAAKAVNRDKDDFLKMMKDMDVEMGLDTDEDDNETGGEQNDEEQAKRELNVPIYATTDKVNLFGSSLSIWRMFGWGFSCSTLADTEYSRRWSQWRNLFEFLLDLLELDHSLAPRYEDTLISSWLEGIGTADVLNAILATARRSSTDTIALDYKRILKQEKLPDISESEYDGGKFDQDAAVLRSRLLDLIMAEDEDTALKVERQCHSYLQKLEDYIALIGADDPHARPHTLARMVWSRHIGGIAYARKNPLDTDYMCEILKSVPSRANYVDHNEAIFGLLFSAYDAFVHYLKTQYAKSIFEDCKKIKHAHLYGRQEREKWYQRRKLVDSTKIQRLEESLAKLIESVTSSVH